MPTIYIDNRPYTVKEGRNLLDACLDLGFDIPYFCWHPAMHSVGSCRVCAVKQFKDEQDTHGRIVMSCMTPAADNVRISIDDPEVKEFRAGIIELLMMNHPHDCPVCDEGGECHLQDMTVMTGHVYRRFRYRKRTFYNQDLGPFLNHEMNRCIHCYRCIRFYRHYAGGRDLEVLGSQHEVYFGRYEDGALENVFSGNLVEICPTGVFTDKTLKCHFTRKWDLQTAPSVCVHCGLGCNTLPGERYGTLRRVRNRYNGAVNGYFLCDRGRYGYEFVNDERRIRTPVLGKRSHSPPKSKAREESHVREVFNALARLLHFGAPVIGIGSPRASLEANYALRTLVGLEQFHSGMSKLESELVSAIIDILRSGPARSPSLSDVAESEAVLVLGEDIMNTAPLLGLAVRQSIRNRPMELVKNMGIDTWNDEAVRIVMQEMKGPLYIATPDRTALDDIATETYRASPDDLARFGFAVAHAINGKAPEVPGLADDIRDAVVRVADSLKTAKRPLVICGTGCGSKALIEATANVAWALSETGPPASLCFVTPESNSLGLGLMDGLSFDKAIDRADGTNIETVIVLENDLYRRADGERVSTFLDSVAHVIVLDALPSRTTEQADVVLPVTTTAESTGTLVNNEGRAQRFFKVFAPEEPVRESWRWLLEMMSVAGKSEGTSWRTLYDISVAMSEDLAVFSPVPEAAPDPGYRETGRKLSRQTHRYSGRTAMYADKTMHEPKPPDDPDSPLTFSMEGYHRATNASLVSAYWYPGWNSVQSLSKFQSESGSRIAGGDHGVRLIEPLPDHALRYFKDIPEPFKARRDRLMVIPAAHIYGSEELSAYAPGIAEISAKPSLALSAADASHFSTADGEELLITVNGVLFRLPVRVHPSLPRGVAALTTGLPGLPWVSLPAWGSITASEVKR
jgi:NADH-quinone oxidoreductase subunit G